MYSNKVLPRVPIYLYVIIRSFWNKSRIIRNSMNYLRGCHSTHNDIIIIRMPIYIPLYNIKYKMRYILCIHGASRTYKTRLPRHFDGYYMVVHHHRHRTRIIKTSAVCIMVLIFYILFHSGFRLYEEREETVQCITYTISIYNITKEEYLYIILVYIIRGKRARHE